VKIVIEKKAQATIDTGYERTRIRKCFGKKKDKETLFRLLQLMDAVESLNWQKAKKLIEGKWWRGRDKECECPRLEFIGTVFNRDDVPELFSHHSSYIELIYSFTEYPENFRVCAVIKNKPNKAKK